MSSTTTTRIFFLFLLCHIVIWTLIPALVRYNLPLDALEGAVWGHQLEWGYDKNPFLNAWLTALALRVGPDWFVYLFSQLSVGICFLSVWQLGRKILPGAYVLIAVLWLEGLQYYNVHAIDFNDNTLELGLWGLTCYFFYCTITTPNYKNWFLTGMTAGLSMMTKYYSGLLLISMLGFFLTQPTCRQQFLRPPLYLGGCIFLLIVLPHLCWLPAHDDITVTYMFARTKNDTITWLNHFLNPIFFTWEQLQILLPGLLLLTLWFLPNKQTPPATTQQQRRYLLYVGLGPFLLTILLSLVLGIKLRAGWGMPLMSLWGLLLVTYVPLHITPKRCQGFVSTMFIFMFLLAGAYAYALRTSKSYTSANFPGKLIALTLTQQWHTTYHTSLTFVAGRRWIAGNVAHYSPDQPSTLMEWNYKRSFWINPQQFQQQGALFVWEEKDAPDFHALQQAYPRLTAPQYQEFPFFGSSGRKVKLGVAFLPPS